MDVVYLRPVLAYYVVATLLSLSIFLKVQDSLIAFEVLKLSSEPFRGLSGGFLLLSVAIAATAPHGPWVLWGLWAIATVGLGFHVLMMSWKPDKWHAVSTIFSMICLFIVAIIAFAGTFS